jgi:hypothetical protein
LETQIRQNVEAYIDFVVVKSEKHGDLLDKLKETFDNLRKYMMMLNPKKCVWCIIRRTARLHGISLGNQCKSEEGGGHWTIVVTLNLKRNPKAHRHDGSAQPIYIQIGRARYAFLQATMQNGWLPVGWSGNGSFHRAQAISKVLANTSSTESK